MIYKKQSSRDGIVRFYIRFDTPGGKKREFAGLSRKAAENLERQRKVEVATGTYVDPDAPPPSTAGPLFKDFAKDFLEKHTGKRRSNHYPSNVKELVKHFGERPIGEITRGDLDAY